jgi:tetratricopeptide (TPR) repeat protein
MKRASAALAVAAGFALVSLPALTLAMGSGGMGGGGMPSGGGMSTAPTGPQYDPEVEYQHGTADLQAGKYKDAVNDFEHVTQAAPRSANGWLMLGEAMDGAGDAKGAEKAYQRSVKIDDSSVPAHRELALTEIKLNQMDKAHGELADLQTKAAKCGDSCSDAADLKAAISAIQAAMPGASPAAAPAASNDTATHLSVATPEAGDGAYVRAVSLINERRWDDALVSLDKAETAIGPHPDILTYKGYVWRKKGDWAKAEDFYRQALAIDPSHRGATEYYGELKVLKGDVAGARAMLAKLDSVCTYGCAEAVELRLWIDHGGDPAA